MRGLRTICVAVCAVSAALAQNSADELIGLIRQNDLAALGSRLAAGADVNAHDARDTTLLMYAAGFGSVDAVKLLLDRGANVNAKNQFDNTALIYGAGNNEKARLLVAKGADVNAKTKRGRTPLMVAAACDGCSATVKLLLEKGADAKVAGDHKVSAVQAAAQFDDLESLRLLIAHGGDAAAADEAGDDPLQFAATNCNLPAVKLLLAKGANVNSANVFGGEVKFGKIQLVGLTPLMLAASYCSPELVKTLLDAGAKVSPADIRGMTPLMFAVSGEEQNPAVAKLLIKAGSDVNAKSKVGETALDWAEKFGNKAVIAALSEAGAKPGLAYSAPARKAAAGRDALQAVEKATALLQRGATEFFIQSGCVGCHHQPATLSAVTVARKVGAHVSEEEAGSYVKMMEGMMRQFQQPFIERLDVGGAADPSIAVLTALAGEGYPATPSTDVMAGYIANYQRHDGSWWLGGTARAPMEESAIARTALALKALEVYGTPGMRGEFASHIERARDFLLRARARTNDEAAMQIVGLHWAGASEAKIRALAATLIAAQRADGGWAQNPNLASDAYATGEALWALEQSGALQPADAVYRKGVRFLLDTQWEDGSWYVRSRAPKFQPYFQSGFPYDHDQWISSTATSWAVRGLAPAVENQKRVSQ